MELLNLQSGLKSEIQAKEQMHLEMLKLRTDVANVTKKLHEADQIIADLRAEMFEKDGQLSDRRDRLELGGAKNILKNINLKVCLYVCRCYFDFNFGFQDLLQMVNRPFLTDSSKMQLPRLVRRLKQRQSVRQKPVHFPLTRTKVTPRNLCPVLLRTSTSSPSRPSLLS